MQYKEEFNWINDLKNEGYKYMIMPKGKSKKFYATKSDDRMKNGKFYAAAEFDEFALNKGESWIPGKDSKNVYIKL